MNVEIGTEAPIFLFWEYLFQIFGILSLQCGNWWRISAEFSCSHKGNTEEENNGYVQCSGTLYVSFRASWIQIRYYLIRPVSGSFHQQAKNVEKNLDTYRIMTSEWLVLSEDICTRMYLG